VGVGVGGGVSVGGGEGGYVCLFNTL
jgi:hypothetical protein